MKILYKEYSSLNYASYQFPYCVYAIREPGDACNTIYQQGFLPYSNDLDRNDEIFYLARSVRINLLNHKNNFKQNNIYNKFSDIFDPAKITLERVAKQTLVPNPEFQSWCLRNAKNHFLKPERLSYILERPYLKDILIISYQEDILAYLFIIHEKRDFIHVWFSFYDISVQHNDFGKWILLNAIEWSKNIGYRYFYIGTCYPPGGFYKLTLSRSMEFFNGERWDDNISGLKRSLSAT